MGGAESLSMNVRPFIGVLLLALLTGCAAPQPATVVPQRVAAKSVAATTPSHRTGIVISWAQPKYNHELWPNWQWQVQRSTNLMDWQIATNLPTGITRFITAADQPFEFFRVR